MTYRVEQKGYLAESRLLREVVWALNLSQLPYYVVGNYAVDAFTGQNFQSRKRAIDEISGDIDILTPSPVKVRVELDKAGIQEGLLRKLHIKGKKVDLGINSVVDLSDVSRPRLHHRSIDIPLPAEVFTTYWVSTASISFPTLSPETLIHLYALSWHLGKENHASIAALTNWISVHQGNKQHKELYQGFYQFNEERRTRYPCTAFIRENVLRSKYRLAAMINRERC